MTSAPRPTAGSGSQRADSRNVDAADVIGSRHYFAGEHLRAARLMASRCHERERMLLEHQRDDIPFIDYDVRSFAVCAVLEAVAFLEARVNEVWHDAIETPAGEPCDRLAGLDKDQIGAIGALAEDSSRTSSIGPLDKLSVTLECVTGHGIDAGRRPGQDVKGLVQLRNALVHFKPELQWDNETHKLEARLSHLVPPNPLMRGGGPWFPHHALCAGVARWACVASANLIREWERSLGLTFTYNVEHALIITEM